MARGGKCGRPKSAQPCSSSASNTRLDPSSADIHPVEESADPFSERTPLAQPQPGSAPQVNYQSSYASLVDPNEGTELRYIPASIVNSVKCARIEKADVELKISYWQNAVLCTVLGASLHWR